MKKEAFPETDFLRKIFVIQNKAVSVGEMALFFWLFGTF